MKFPSADSGSLELWSHPLLPGTIWKLNHRGKTALILASISSSRGNWDIITSVCFILWQRLDWAYTTKPAWTKPYGQFQRLECTFGGLSMVEFHYPWPLMISLNEVLTRERKGSRGYSRAGFYMRCMLGHDMKALSFNAIGSQSEAFLQIEINNPFEDLRGPSWWARPEP